MAGEKRINQVEEEQSGCMYVGKSEKESRDREEEEEIWTAGREEIALAIARR